MSAFTPRTDAARAAASVRAVLPGARSAGERLLLLPGLGQTPAHWGPFARWLTGRGLTLLAAEPAALAAGSTAPRGSYARVREMAGALAAACREHGVAGVLGHSAGAPAALLTASLAGFATVTLIEPVPAHFGLRAATPDPVLRRHGPGGPETSHLVALPDEEPGDSLRRLHPLAAETTLRAITAALRAQRPAPAPPPPLPATKHSRLTDRAEQTAAALASHHGQVLVLRGAHSALLTRADAETLTARAANGTLRVVERAGHSPHIDAPRATVAALLEGRS
ncbi:alpha/beta fold hydrolase [Streptomyces sp. KMM 9044]|uniref:alpha/beta fold hydrolase n=1 Tax=Streptomyces sp. KMM 9044 TaxID=2744474 RepID=UPI002150D7E3|nr:alpha/beta hydrolase [Streptomyces sp. KMM 9044]WAX76554.1 alpha/beta hydrolase [Streptomyces sp. KMM 9044]